MPSGIEPADLGLINDLRSRWRWTKIAYFTLASTEHSGKADDHRDCDPAPHQLLPPLFEEVSSN